MSSAPRVLLFDADREHAVGLQERLSAAGLAPEFLPLGTTPRAEQSRKAAAALVIAADPDASDSLTELLARLNSQKLPTLLWGAVPAGASDAGPLIEALPAVTSLDEISGRLAMLARFAPQVRRLERELDQLQRLGEQLNRYFGEIDQEMRLAGRLQHDFLPRVLPNRDAVDFAALYRPASWVSGDMYDVFAIDERHVGVFIADAMGHGVAAGLMTMFLRQALVTKRLRGREHEIVSPAEAMGTLHEALLRQNLPNCQFVTAAYGIIDLETRAFRLARGGHPYPVRITKDGRFDEIRAVGGLLGLDGLPAEFGETTITLNRGDKLFFYSDGAEDVLLAKADAEHAADGPGFSDEFRSWSPNSAAGMIEALAGFLDRQEGSLHPADDVTAVAVELK